MISYFKHFLKAHPLTHKLSRRTRDFFLPHMHLYELSSAWNKQFYVGDNPELCFALYQKNRDFQRRLAARLHNSGELPTRYLGAEWTSNIGTLAHLDTYVKIGLLGWRSPQESVLVAYPNAIGNRFLLNLWKAYFTLLDDPRALQRAYREIMILMDYHLMTEVKEKPYVFPTAAALVQKEWEKQGRLPLLQLDQATRERGQAALAKIGMPRDAWFVALHVREKGYKSDELDRCVRNACPDTYLGAIRRIVAAGGWVVRLGDPSMRPLPRMDRVFDYAVSSMRDDWLDIFLASQCRFLIGGQSGVSHVGDVFGVPTLYANWASWGYWPWYGRNIILPKVFHGRRPGRHLTYREVVGAGLGWCQNVDVFTAKEIDIVDNTPEEIERAVEEMLAATNGGAWHPGAPQEDLKKRFDDLGVILNGRLSDAFVKTYDHCIA